MAATEKPDFLISQPGEVKDPNASGNYAPSKILAQLNQVELSKAYRENETGN